MRFAHEGFPLIHRESLRQVDRLEFSPLWNALHGTDIGPLIFRRTKNLRVVQRWLGHTKIESNVKYVSVKAEDALEMAEQIDI